MNTAGNVSYPGASVHSAHDKPIRALPKLISCIAQTRPPQTTIKSTFREKRNETTKKEEVLSDQPISYWPSFKSPCLNLSAFSRFSICGKHTSHRECSGWRRPTPHTLIGLKENIPPTRLIFGCTRPLRRLQTASVEPDREIKQIKERGGQTRTARHTLHTVHTVAWQPGQLFALQHPPCSPLLSPLVKEEHMCVRAS